MASSTRIVTRNLERETRNEGTRFSAPLRRRERLAPERLRERWQEILERIHSWRAEHPEGDAIAVVVRDGDDFDVTLKQVDGAPIALVVGRHTNCDLVLPEGGHASLRHAAVIAWP